MIWKHSFILLFKKPSFMCKHWAKQVGLVPDVLQTKSDVETKINIIVSQWHILDESIVYITAVCTVNYLQMMLYLYLNSIRMLINYWHITKLKITSVLIIFCYWDLKWCNITCEIADLPTVTKVGVTGITQTSYNVTWTKAEGNLYGYVVECICTENNTTHRCLNARSQNLTKDIQNYKCTGLTPGSMYQTYIKSVRTNWPDEMAPTSPTTRTS